MHGQLKENMTCYCCGKSLIWIRENEFRTDENKIQTEYMCSDNKCNTTVIIIRGETNEE